MEIFTQLCLLAALPLINTLPVFNKNSSQTETETVSPLIVEKSAELPTSENHKTVIKGTKQEGGLEGVLEGLAELAFPANVDFIPDAGESASRLYAGLLEQPLQQFGKYILGRTSSPKPVVQDVSTPSSGQDTYFVVVTDDDAANSKSTGGGSNIRGSSNSGGGVSNYRGPSSAISNLPQYANAQGTNSQALSGGSANNIQGNSNNNGNINYKTQTNNNGPSAPPGQTTQKVTNSESSKKPTGPRKPDGALRKTSNLPKLETNEDYDNAQEMTKKPGVYFLTVPDTPPVSPNNPQGQNNYQQQRGTEDDEVDINNPIVQQTQGKPPSDSYKIIPNKKPLYPDSPPQNIQNANSIPVAHPNYNQFTNPQAVVNTNNQQGLTIPQNAQISTIFTDGLPSAIGATGNVQVYIDQSNNDPFIVTTKVPLTTVPTTTEDEDDDGEEEAGDGENVAKS